MKYEDMSDFEINRRVAIRLEIEIGMVQSSNNKFGTVNLLNGRIFNPCNNPSDAWPIIFENKIAIEWFTSDLWRAQCDNQFQPGEFKVWTSYCYKPLRAAMICFLKMKDAEK